MHCKSIMADPQVADGIESAFCTASLPNLGGLLWRCPATVRFSVKAKTGSGDSVVFAGISDGTVTPFAAHDDLYIADSRGASVPFAVTICAILVPR